jgi:hypothetical protein
LSPNPERATREKAQAAHGRHRQPWARIVNRLALIGSGLAAARCKGMTRRANARQIVGA